MSAFTTTALSMANHRACDCCNRRKVKCDRGQPCQSCFRAELACTYAAIPRKRGPQGPSAKRIYAIKLDQLRNSKVTVPEANTKKYSRSPSSDVDDQASAASVPHPNTSSTGERADVTALFTAFLQCDFVPSAQLDVFEPHPMLAQSSVEVCLKIFFESLYPIMPVLHQTSFLARLGNLLSDPELYALVSSLCAMTMIQLLAVPGNHNELISPISETLISESLRARKYCDYIGSPSFDTVLTSYFLFCSYGNLEKHNNAWYYLRESISFAQSIGLDDEKSYLGLDPPENQLRRRLFWLLFISERAYALQRHRPLGLRQSIALPSLKDTCVDTTLLSNFTTLVTLFQNVDHSFLDLWNEGNGSEFSDSWIFKLHEQLKTTIRPLTDAVRIQKVDILVSQQWLHLLVWQLSLAKGRLSSTAPTETMTLQFPIVIAKAVLEVTSRVSLSDLEAHGIGMQEKLYDVGCALSDVIMCIPNVSTPTFEVDPRDSLKELIYVLAGLRGGHSRYFKGLVAKVENVLQLNSPLSGAFSVPTLNCLDFGQPDSESERPRVTSSSEPETVHVMDYVY